MLSLHHSQKLTGSTSILPGFTLLPPAELSKSTEQDFGLISIILVNGAQGRGGGSKWLLSHGLHPFAHSPI